MYTFDIAAHFSPRRVILRLGPQMDILGLADVLVNNSVRRHGGRRI